ncbi:Pectin lyase-like superfamily protein [Citrus sinensis]|uniref:Pectin lyase-like superfamily protein n=1 Tax=Citrus sinensis TaxID=2711 RepID=A0ACB8ITE1_CITSI|nr:exopolygalacturonase clone GBGA483 [Citrus x clementina]KAH9699575.1 Pectin lyase-like superfamily protein [Citrus sinensis]
MGFSSYSQQAFSLLVLFITSVKGIDATNRVFNVKDFGAAADGIKDDSKAFGTAWREACNWDGIESTVLVTPGKYLSNFVELEGPCKAPISFQLQGLVQAPTGLSKLPDKQSWITFQYLRHFTLSGEGTFHGQGETAWPLNQCHKNSDCQLPTSMRFNFLNDSTITGIKSVGSKYFHINILGCYNLKINDLKITAHADSPNTNGIHIGRSNGIEISHSVIATGDDCVCLGQGSKNILVSDVFFGPGHGISVGRLGKDTKDEEVVGLTVPSQVKISNVRFNNIRGTSATKVAVSLVCSQKIPCQNIEIGNINLVYNGVNVKVEGPETTSLCSNVKPTLFGKQIPATCV